MVSSTTDEESIFVQAVVFLATPSRLSLTLVAVLVLWCTYNITLHPLARYPGPLVARLGLPGGLWPFWQAYRRRYAWSLERAHDRYGTIVRISGNHLSFSSPYAAQQIYAHGSGATLPKTTFYRSFQVYPTQPSLFSEIVPHKHAAFRRAISNAYSMNSMVKMEEYIEPLLKRFTARLVKETTKNDDQAAATLDMAKWLHFFAMDAVGELAFGDSFGFVERGSDGDRFLDGVSNLSHWGSMAGWIPAFSQTIRTWLKRLSGQPGGEVVGRATEPLLNRRYELLARKDGAEKPGNKEIAVAAAADEDDQEERQDMLANFIRCTNPTTGEQLSKIEVLRTAISVVAAGSDTTATALTAFVGFIVRDATVYAELQKEIDEAFDAGSLTWPVKYAQAVKLPFLQACIKETLRLHPPISMSLPRYVAEAPSSGLVLHVGQPQARNSDEDDNDDDDDTISNNATAADSAIVVPAGCQVSVSPYVLHRNTRVFGRDARSFNPRRWLHLSDARRRDMERNNLAFGGGARQCIGRNISLMELNKALPTLFRAFTFSLPSSKPSSSSSSALLGRDSDGQESASAPFTCNATWFHEISNFPLSFTRRDDVEIADEGL